LIRSSTRGHAANREGDAHQACEGSKASLAGKECVAIRRVATSSRDGDVPLATRFL
jgi:hypothetical protein